MGSSVYQEILDLYLSEVYGSTGLDKGEVGWTVLQQFDKFLADKAIYRKIQVTYKAAQGEYQFPFHLTLPKSVEKTPVFLYLSFGEEAARHLYISSAADDEWADGTTENIDYPQVGTIWHEGRIGHHLRTGKHFLSRYDWNQMIAYRNKHNC